MKVSILGAGLVGFPMALDLYESERAVTLCDIDDKKLSRAEDAGIEILQGDLSDPSHIEKCVKEADLVINSVPGFMGFHTLKHLIELKKNVVDIAFSPEDVFTLDSRAKENGVTVVFDAGVAPGMSNILAAHSIGQMDRCDHVRILVGGLPEERKWPFEYKAGFSPADVIEEYNRPARLVRDGKQIVMPALSEAEFVDIDGIGTLEAFNSDGLRSLIHTIDCPNMSEKTLRYPGHIEKIAVLKAMGLFSLDPLDVGGQQVRPVNVAEKLLFPLWELGPADKDVTVMKIEVTGIRDGKPWRAVWDLFDRYDPATGIHSMARTTGYTATAIANLIMERKVEDSGVLAPEMLAMKEGVVEAILEHLETRGVKYVNRSFFL